MHRFVRLSLVTGAALAVIGGAVTAVPSSAASGGGECNLAGTANFKGLGGTDPTAAFSYDFSGALTGCTANDTSAPTTGGVSAGQTYTAPDGTTHQEPAATGTGGCAAGDTTGIAFITWSDGSRTIISYTTGSVAAGVALEGQTLPTYRFGDGYTATSTRYYSATASGAVGLLQFSVADPTACVNPGGVSTAGISGVTGVGTAT